MKKEFEKVEIFENVEDYCEKNLKDAIEIEIKEQEEEEQTDATDEEINDSLNSFESVNNPDTKKMQRKSKKTMQQIADDVVGTFLANKTDKNWEAVQNFFWYGIKQYAYKFVRVMEVAEDMTIETFINAHSKIDTFDPTKGRFSTWIFTCCKHNCFGYIKQKAKMDIVDNDISDIFDSELISSAYAQSIDDIEYNFSKDGADAVTYDQAAKDMYDTMLVEMKRFGGVVSQIMTMKYLDNMKIREIADILNMNESTVKNHLYRGREDLVNIIKINHSQLYNTYIDAKYHRNQMQYYA